LVWTHMSFMILTILWMVFVVWNHSMSFRRKPTMDCGVWFYCLILTQWTGRIFMYLFLMLRSKLAFQNSAMEFNARLINGLMVLFTILLLIGMVGTLTESTGVQSPFNGKCFRLSPDEEWNWNTVLTYFDLFASACCLLAFGTKAWTASRMMSDLHAEYYEAKNKRVPPHKASDSSDSHIMGADEQKYQRLQKSYKAHAMLFKTFKRHVLLGSLTVMGSFVLIATLTWLYDFVGPLFLLDAFCNILCIFLMFNTLRDVRNIFCPCFTGNKGWTLRTCSRSCLQNEENEKEDNSSQLSSDGPTKTQDEVQLAMQLEKTDVTSTFEKTPDPAMTMVMVNDEP